MLKQFDPTITTQDLERMRRLGAERRAEASLTSDFRRKQELLDRALSYERMADRGERLMKAAR
jgi:hypothetical protein